MGDGGEGEGDMGGGSWVGDGVSHGDAVQGPPADLTADVGQTLTSGISDSQTPGCSRKQ